jgi:hypothetical protein
MRTCDFADRRRTPITPRDVAETFGRNHTLYRCIANRLEEQLIGIENRAMSELASLFTHYHLCGSECRPTQTFLTRHCAKKTAFLSDAVFLMTSKLPGVTPARTALVTTAWTGPTIGTRGRRRIE